jgi:peptidoglycan DL-endopeptidase CwlO
VLSQVDALASQFFSGDAVDAFAAAASLNVDPSEIAGMSLNLTYTSNTFQATATSNSSAGSTQAGSAGSQSPVATSSVSGTLLGDSDSGDGASGDTESASASATSGAGNSSGTSDATASTTASNASPQQVITAFLQGVMGKLGRNTSIGGIHMSSSLKLQLLALAMPAYAQAQDTAQSVPTSIGAGISAPSATSTGASGSQPAQQGARLAAATLRQMAS